jgi:hypothetical protein
MRPTTEGCLTARDGKWRVVIGAAGKDAAHEKAAVDGLHRL